MPKQVNRHPGVTKRGDKWEARYYGPDGKRHSRQFKTQAEAVRWKSEQLQSRDRGDWLDPGKAQIRLHEWISIWARGKANITEKTWASYDSQIRVHIAPYLGNVKLSQLSHTKIQEWQRDRLESGVGVVVLNRSTVLLRQILQVAVVDGRLSKNPAEHIALIPVAPSSNAENIVTKEELFALVHGAGVYGDVILVCALTGLRWGELAGLQVRDVNPLHKTLQIERAVTTNRRGEVVLGSTKTRQTRRIPLSQEALSTLLKWSEGKSPEDFVFHGPRSAQLNYEWFMRAVFKPAKRSIGRSDFTFHGLRHSCASLLHSLGAPLSTVSAVLGHSSIRTTLEVYTHHYQEDSAAFMERLGDSYSEAHSHEVTTARASKIRPDGPDGVKSVAI